MWLFCVPSGMPSWNRSSLKNPSCRTDQKSNPCHIPHQTPAPVVPAAIHCNHCNHCNIPSLNFYINGDRNAEIVASFKELVQPKRSRSLRYSMQNSQGWTQRSEGLGSGRGASTVISVVHFVKETPPVSDRVADAGGSALRRPRNGMQMMS